MSTSISVVIPVYQAESCLEELYLRLYKVLKKISEKYEIILVDDGSSDASWPAIKALCRVDRHVRGIRLSRNFGQHHAITAGLDVCDGEWCVIMDCDLQDLPEEIVNLYKKAISGFDVVQARRVVRKDNGLKKITSRMFYQIFNFFTGKQHDHTIANFGIYKRIVIENVVRMREYHRFFPTSIVWLGFSRAFVEVKHGTNKVRKSSYNLVKLTNLGMDTVISYSNKPLTIFVQGGFITSLLALVTGLGIILRYLIWKIPIQGWTSIIVSIYFIGGLMFFGMGILGLYVGKIFDEVKGRPLYVVSESINVEGNK